jgi:putative heme-binding domain-containing protein
MCATQRFRTWPVFLAATHVWLGLAIPLRAEDKKQDLQDRNDAIVILALERLPNYDWRHDSRVSEAVERQLARTIGTRRHFELVRALGIENQEPALVQLAAREGASNLGVEIVGYLLQSENGRSALQEQLRPTAETAAAATRLCEAASLSNAEGLTDLLKSALANEGDYYDLRAAAVRGLARQTAGQQWLLSAARQGSLPADMRLLVASLTRRSNDTEVKKAAEAIFPAPPADDQHALPPIEELAQRSGDAQRGEQLFRTAATCANCHIVRGFGKSVGPDLSEIGQKLSREAMLVALLDPSAGISHNYENWIALLDSGQVVSGLKISETDSEVVLRSADGIDQRLDRETIESLQKSEKSLMPENLHHNFDLGGLMDLIEYMTSLRSSSG